MVRASRRRCDSSVDQEGGHGGLLAIPANPFGEQGQRRVCDRIFGAGHAFISPRKRSVPLRSKGYARPLSLSQAVVPSRPSIGMYGMTPSSKACA